MGYSRQSSLLDRMSRITLQAQDRLHKRQLQGLADSWLQTRSKLMTAIVSAYRSAAPHEAWDLSRFKWAAPYLQSRVRSILEQWQAVMVPQFKKDFNDIYQHSMLRHAWMLDQLTPRSVKVKVPHNHKLHEAAITVYSATAKASQNWTQRWSAWSEAWQSALYNNLQLGAVNESTIQSAMDEVDATTAGTPRSSLWQAISRMNDYETMVAAARGAADLADLNGDIVDEEIWKTRGDLRVCDDCDELNGQPIEDIDEYPPLHPNCHCYTLVVPKSFAELLRSGDDNDRALASDAMDRGIVPSSIIIRDDAGNIAAQAIVDFQKWKEDQGFAVRSGGY